MILRILIINENKKNLGDIKRYLKEDFCEVIEANSVEDALSVAGRCCLDLVLLVLSNINSLYVDFLAVLRITLGVTPLIGIADKSLIGDFPGFTKCGVDDIVYTDITKEDLWRTVNALSNTKDKMCGSCVVTDNLGEQKEKRITIFSEYEFSLFDSSFLSTGTVVRFYREKTDQMNFSDEDAFIIDIRLRNIEKLCASLKLNGELCYKPIFLLTDKEHKDKALALFNKNMGIIDIINKETHPSIISCRMNAHIKYKRILDKFYSEVKKNIYTSSVDALTTVYNRGFLEEYIDRRKNALHNSAIVMIDIDKFKEINDKHGHAFADKVLNELVAHIKSYIRLSDFIARYGGDEFLIFMKNISRPEIEQVCNRLVKSVKQKLFNGIHCTISIGICYVSAESVDLRKAIYVADSFMYIAKRAGGNAYYLC